MWFRVAETLGKTVRECQSHMTSTEFVQWRRYFEIKLNLPERTDFYLAQVAAEVRRGHVKEPRSVEVRDLILKFKIEGEKKKPIDPHTRLKRSKDFWMVQLPAAMKAAKKG